MRKLKTDASDALLIADLVRFKAFEPSAMADEATAGIRDLARFRMSLVEECTTLKNQLKALMDRAFPEYETLFSDMFYTHMRCQRWTRRQRTASATYSPLSRRRTK